MLSNLSGWDVLLAAVVFIAMEAVAAAEHRWAMHGFAWSWHRSHHLPPAGRFEANDRFPFVFAGLAIVLFVAGTNVDALGFLVPVAIGITAYGAAYFVVHDVYIHGRLGGRHLPRVGALDRLAAAHELHHRFNGAPYGMLVPVVPERIRTQADTSRAAPIDLTQRRRATTERVES
ncbi:MAG: sterol desaturase family protein [Acidobacteria bacterium]|nr:sterol desaturase family protein [Acidobacteriota bacterium]